MKLLNKLKSDRQDLITNLIENIASLEKIAFEQQAEIEQYKRNEKFIDAKCDSILEKVKTLISEINEAIAKAKSEAIKEFAERLKATDTADLVGEQYINGEIYGYFYSVAFERKIDNLVKEMVGDDNA